MKKILEIFKSNWMFLIFIIPFIFVCYENKTPDNDIWFLLNNGRYVLEHGFPTIDPFSIHEGLSYVMQQWLSAVIYFLIFKWFGKTGLLIFIYVVSFIILYFLYKLFYRVNDNKVIAILLSSLCVCLIEDYIVLRPQVFTYLILIIEIYLLESYVKTKNNKYLFVLPVLSMLLINLHSAMWYMQFVFMLPFIVNSFKIKGITIDSYKLKPILIIVLFMLMVGFINPYGMDAMTMIFKSYGVSDFNKYISEMKNPVTSDYFFIVVMGISFIILCCCNFFKKCKLDVRHYCFICGTFILFSLHVKCFPYFIIISLYAFAYLIRKVKIKNILDNKIVFAIYRGVAFGLSVMLVGSFIYTSYLSIKYYDFKSQYALEVTDYLLEHYNVSEVKLYNEFDDGGYISYKGIKVYIDGRAEVFIKRFNEKEDIFKEAMMLKNCSDEELEKFINKYEFTHMFVYTYSNLDEYMKTHSDYEVKYIEYFDTEKTQEFLKLYVRKGVEEK